jgi:NAD(P)-dependent dehydrogenase (short-subunit alcohol dehydrogenase family)
MSELAGKIALVTGASRGIGRAIALRLAAEGALVAVHYASNQTAAAAVVSAIEATGGGAISIASDLGLQAGPERLFQAFDAALAERRLPIALDILVNNAGIGGRNTIDAVTEAEFERIFQLDFKAAFFVIQRALPRLRDGGRIINISSTAARIGYAETPVYAAAKAALEALSLPLAKQLGKRGITVNAVAPGAVATELNPLATNELSARQIATETILGRVGKPEDIADVVAFLASDRARWITGQRIEASGGLRI